MLIKISGMESSKESDIFESELLKGRYLQLLLIIKKK